MKLKLMLRPFGLSVPSSKISLISCFFRRVLSPLQRLRPQIMMSLSEWEAELKCSNTTESRVPLVLTFNRFNTGTKRILFDNFQMLLSDPATRTIYPELPLVSYRRDRNLRDYLVHSAERTDSDAGTFACRHPRCLTCQHT